MPLSWNEIRHRAIAFSREWAGVKSERAEKQTFWNEFFNVFGIRRRVVATFEEPVRKLSGEYEFIDLFWPGILLVEHKSFGKSLGKAESQAFRYIQDLVREGRMNDIPRYVIVSDFARIALHDLEPDDQRPLPLFENRRVFTVEFPLSELHHNINSFAFIPGYKQHKFVEQDPINIEAVEIMGRLHDALEIGGYSGHQLERFLVRILFCLFAEDTGIFDRESFRLYLLNRTAEAPDEPRRGPRCIHLCQRRPLRRKSRIRGLQSRHAQRAPRMHPFRLVPHLTSDLWFAISGRHGAQGTEADWRPLHKRAGHTKGHSLAFPRRPPRRI